MQFRSLALLTLASMATVMVGLLAVLQDWRRRSNSHSEGHMLQDEEQLRFCIITRVSWRRWHIAEIMALSGTAWARQLNPALDRHFHIYDGVSSVPAGPLAEQPQPLPGMVMLPEALESSCARVAGKSCGEGDVARMRLPAAFLHLFEEFHSKQVNVLWWILKEEDTWVNPYYLQLALEKFSPSEKLLFVDRQCQTGLCAGAGMVLSAALASVLPGLGADWLTLSAHGGQQEQRVKDLWDTVLLHIVAEIEGARVVDLPQIFAEGPLSPICTGASAAATPRWTCVRDPPCQCARARKTAMWHLSGQVETSMKELSMYRTRR